MIINNFYVGDNLELMKEISDESIQLIYTDPPYNSGRNFGDFMDKYPSLYSYTYDFIKPRLIEMKRILKKDGVIIFHVEPKISHYIRLVMDEVFGINNFQNEVIWKTGGNMKSSKKLQRYHDNLIVYSKSKKYIYNQINLPYDEAYKQKNTIRVDEVGEYITTAAHYNQPDMIQRPNMRYNWNGHYKQWHVLENTMKQLHDKNRLYYNKDGIPRFKKYLHEMDGLPIRDLWTDIGTIQSKEKLDYATQKPVKLLERIINIYSNECDLIMDPFAGSGSLGRAAVNTNRNYLLFDINDKAKEIFYKKKST